MSYAYIHTPARLSVWEVQDIARDYASHDYIGRSVLHESMTHLTHIGARAVYWRYMDDNSTLIAVQVLSLVKD